MAKTTDPTTTMTDEELAELLEERGHTGSATSLRQKLTAERAVAANVPPPLAHDEFAPARRLNNYYETARDGRQLRNEARNKPTTDGGHDGE